MTTVKIPHLAVSDANQCRGPHLRWPRLPTYRSSTRSYRSWGVLRDDERASLHPVPDRIARHGQIADRELFCRTKRPVYNSDAAVHALYAGEAVPLIESAFSANVACPRPRASWRRTTEVTRDHELRSVRLVIKCDV